MRHLVRLPSSNAVTVRLFVCGLALAGLASCGSLPWGARAQDMGAFLTEPVAAPAPPAPPVQDGLSLPIPQLPQGLSRAISAEEPARIMVIGDSLSQGFADALSQRVKERGLPATVQNRGRVSTGLSRTDFHDWPADFAALAAAERPDIVVAHFGANDMQGVTRPENRAGYGTEEWDAAYRTEVRRILTTAAEQGIVLLWVGPAPDGNSGLGRHMTVINPLFAAEANASGAIFLPLGPITSGPDGGFVKAVPIDGREVTIRTGDGSHFNMTGYRFVADAILDALLARLPVLQPGGDQLAELQ